MKAKLKLLIALYTLITSYSFSQSINYTAEAEIPEYEKMKQPFKISGVLYMSDGVTPAKNYLVTINQPNEDGNFEEDTNGNLITRATVKTNENGEYTFYTYVPGSDRLYNKLQEIFMKVETPTGDAYPMPTLLFDQDPKLTKRCRKLIAKRSDTSRILKLNKVNDSFEVNRNMTLTLDLETIN